jgi:hypothetical protein
MLAFQIKYCWFRFVIFFCVFQELEFLRMISREQTPEQVYSRKRSCSPIIDIKVEMESMETKVQILFFIATYF